VSVEWEVTSTGDADEADFASGTTVTWTCTVMVFCTVVVLGWMSWTTAIGYQSRDHIARFYQLATYKLQHR